MEANKFSITKFDFDLNNLTYSVVLDINGFQLEKKLKIGKPIALIENEACLVTRFSKESPKIKYYYWVFIRNKEISNYLISHPNLEYLLPEEIKAANGKLQIDFSLSLNETVFYFVKRKINYSSDFINIRDFHLENCYYVVNSIYVTHLFRANLICKLTSKDKIAHFVSLSLTQGYLEAGTKFDVWLGEFYSNGKKIIMYTFPLCALFDLNIDDRIESKHMKACGLSLPIPRFPLDKSEPLDWNSNQYIILDEATLICFYTCGDALNISTQIDTLPENYFELRDYPSSVVLSYQFLKYIDFIRKKNDEKYITEQNERWKLENAPDPIYDRDYDEEEWQTWDDHDRLATDPDRVIDEWTSNSDWEEENIYYEEPEPAIVPNYMLLNIRNLSSKEETANLEPLIRSVIFYFFSNHIPIYRTLDSLTFLFRFRDLPDIYFGYRTLILTETPFFEIETLASFHLHSRYSDSNNFCLIWNKEKLSDESLALVHFGGVDNFLIIDTGYYSIAVSKNKTIALQLESTKDEFNLDSYHKNTSPDLFCGGIDVDLV